MRISFAKVGFDTVETDPLQVCCMMTAREIWSGIDSVPGWRRGWGGLQDGGSWLRAESKRKSGLARVDDNDKNVQHSYFCPKNRSFSFLPFRLPQNLTGSTGPINGMSELDGGNLAHSFFTFPSSSFQKYHPWVAPDSSKTTEKV